MFIDQLLSRLEYIRLAPSRILVIDADSDALIVLQKRYPQAEIIGITSESLERHDGSYDLILAQCPFQDAKNHAVVSQKLFHLLKYQGLLLFTALGPDSYAELQAKTPFIDMHHLGDGMKQVGFLDPVMDRQEIILTYDDFNLLRHEAKSLGIHIFAESEKNWPKNDGEFLVTIELICGHGWKQELKVLSDEVCISVESIPIAKKE